MILTWRKGGRRIDCIVGLSFSVGECNRPHISHNSVFVSTKLDRRLVFPSAVAFVQSRAKVSNNRNSWLALYAARKVQTSRKRIAKSQTVSQLEIGRVTDRAPRPILLLVLRYENTCVCAACARKCRRILFSFFYFFFELRVIVVKPMIRQRKDVLYLTPLFFQSTRRSFATNDTTQTRKFSRKWISIFWIINNFGISILKCNFGVTTDCRGIKVYSFKIYSFFFSLNFYSLCKQPKNDNFRVMSL